MSGSILIIGAGNMGAAFCCGLNEKKSGIKVSCYDIHIERLTSLCAKTGATQINDLTGSLAFDGVLLCVKPQDLPSVSASLKQVLTGSPLIVSILAGVLISDIEEAFSFLGNIPVVRAMPNIAATVGMAATAMCGNTHLDSTSEALAQELFSAIGEAHWTKEDLLDAVTGLSGSGPAYLYMIIEALTDGGVKMGLPRVLSSALAVQTVLGSAVLVKATGLHPAVLRDQVTTPGGTTINAIHELEDRGLRAMLIKAVQTATEHSKDLRAKVK